MTPLGIAIGLAGLFYIAMSLLLIRWVVIHLRSSDDENDDENDE